MFKGDIRTEVLRYLLTVGDPERGYGSQCYVAAMADTIGCSATAVSNHLRVMERVLEWVYSEPSELQPGRKLWRLTEHGREVAKWRCDRRRG